MAPWGEPNLLRRKVRFHVECTGVVAKVHEPELIEVRRAYTSVCTNALRVICSP
jgi:hypothetical protein